MTFNANIKVSKNEGVPTMFIESFEGTFMKQKRNGFYFWKLVSILDFIEPM